MRHVPVPLFFALWLLPASLQAVPRLEVVDFDVSGDGNTSAALRLQQIDNVTLGALSLRHPVTLEVGRTYCVRFMIAVDNRANERNGRYRFAILVGSHEFEVVTEPAAPGSVLRDAVRSVFVAETAGETQLVVGVSHDSGPSEDPSLYIDAIEIVALRGDLLQATYAQQIWMDGSTTLGWSQDFSLQGLRPTDEIGSAAVELVVWDDAPGSPLDGSERLELSVNGVVLSVQDIGGSAAQPYRLLSAIASLECRSGFDGLLHLRLRTVRIGNEPPGDMWFGAATTALHVGRFEANVLDNGGFENGFAGWSCDHPTCASSVQASSWTGVKQLYREH